METIVRLAARGDGVTASGRFVPGAVPGDSLDGDSVVPGAHRAVPPCRHFGHCGGCQLQHVDDTVLADFAMGRVVSALAAAGVAAGTVHPVHLSPSHTRRRASLRAVPAGKSVAIGFNVERGHTVVDLQECHVLTPRLWQAVAALRAPLARIGGGKVVNLTLTEAANGIDVVLGGTVRARDAAALAGFAETHGIVRITDDNGVVLLQSVPVVHFGGVPVELPPGAFLQATKDAEAALQRAVADSVRASKTIADLFCGIGTFALPLSQTAKVVAADAAGPAVAALAAAARRTGRPVKAEHRDLFRQPLDAKALKPFDAVVLDPPRAGAAAQVAELARSSVPVVAYVSCNPNTFARDAKHLVDAGYALTDLWPVGQFRWSLHVELVASFSRP